MANNKIEETLSLLQRNSVIREYVLDIFSNRIDDIIEYAYSCQDVEDWLLRKRNSLQSQIIFFLKNYNNYEWVDTGQSISEVDLLIIFPYMTGAKQIKKSLEKVSLSEMERSLILIEKGIKKIE